MKSLPVASEFADGAIAAVSGVHGALIAVDDAGRILFLNDEAVGVLGSAPTGTSLWGALPDAMVGGLRDLFDGARAQGERRIGSEYLPIGPRWYRAVVTPTGAGATIHLVDATEQKRLEDEAHHKDQARRLEGADLDALLKSWGMVVSYVDASLCYTQFYNAPPAYPEGSYLGKRAYDYANRGGQAMAAFQLEVLESGRSLRREIRYAGEVGERAWLVYGEPLRSGGGTVVGVKTIGLDVTDLRNAETAAATDYLTGLPNRRSMESLVRQELRRTERQGTAVSLIVLDIDHFKLVNDSHGHAAGDAVLRTLAERLGEELRATDTLGRWGGEEFMVLLPETWFEEAANAAERMRASVEALPFGAAGSITISLGVATTVPGEGAEDLIARADAACLRAKRSGRNRVAAAGEEVGDGRAQPLFADVGRSGRPTV